MSIAENLASVNKDLAGFGARLILVTKTQPVSRLLEAYEAGQRAFGENLAQEMTEKHPQLPPDVEWHFVGHLQSNKVKSVAPYVSMIHSVDSLNLLKEINKQALKNDRIIKCLFQVSIADEETKFGLGFDEIVLLLRSEEFKALTNVRICGLMGIATNTSILRQIKDEFYEFKTFFRSLAESFFQGDSNFTELSMGMSGDYKIALEEGSTMVRLGSAIFGKRKKILHEN